MHSAQHTTDVVLDLTTSDEEGFELRFRATESYLTSLRRQIEAHEIDGMHCVTLEFDDVHPVAARVENYLSGTEYDSIGVTGVGPNNPMQTDEDAITLRVYCTRNQLRRFAVFNRGGLEPPLTFTATLTTENAESFIDSVADLTDEPDGR